MYYGIYIYKISFKKNHHPGFLETRYGKFPYKLWNKLKPNKI